MGRMVPYAPIRRKFGSMKGIFSPKTHWSIGDLSFTPFFRRTRFYALTAHKNYALNLYAK